MSDVMVPADEQFLRDFKEMQRKIDDISNASVGGGSLVTGDMVANYSATRAGCLLCNGATIADVDYPALAAYIRANLPVAYVVDGTHVLLPNMQGAVPAGANGATFVLGVATGVENVTLTGAQSGLANHAHAAPTITIGNESAHTHQGIVPAIIGQGTAAGNNINAGTLTSTATTGAGTSHTHSGSSSAIAASGTANASASHTNVQPSIPVNWWIKT